ncbi:MAG: hypothetical protein KAQ92_09165, partial [Candidatus Aenigmarchaeota archaeon]|nr:hypothetical protein [Candidatus Aenigmarchaeota archaeon]
ERYLFSNKSSYFKLELSSVFETLPSNSNITLEFPESFYLGACETSSASIVCSIIDSKTISVNVQKNISKNGGDYVKVILIPSEFGGYIVNANYSIGAVPEIKKKYNPGFFVLVKKPTETYKLNPSVSIVREMPDSIPQKTLCNLNDTFSTCEYFVNRVFLYNKGATEAKELTYTETWSEAYCSIGATNCEPLYFECPNGSVVNWTAYNESNNTLALPTIICEKQDNTTLWFNITKPLYPRNYALIEYLFAPVDTASAYSSSSYYEFQGTANYENQIGDFMSSGETDETYNPVLANTLFLSQNASMNYYFSMTSDATHNNRSFMIDINNNATLSFEALTGDNTINDTISVNITVPDDIAFSKCQFSDGGGTCDIIEKNATGGIPNNLLSISYPSSMIDKSSANLDLSFNSSSFTEWVLPIKAHSSASLMSYFNPGLFILSKDYLYRNITIPYPEPYPQPEPVPTPTPTPQEPEPNPEDYSQNGEDYKLEVSPDETLPPMPPSDESPTYKVVLEIKPLNFTLSTYQGTGVPVLWNITNIGEKTLSSIDIIGVKFEGWDYTDSNIEELQPEESVIRTIMVQPSISTKPGFYVIPVKGETNEEQIGISFFKLQVLKILKLARIEILESPSKIRLKKNSLAKIPVLIKNTGEVNLTNISIMLDALDCMSVIQSDVNQTTYPFLPINTSLPISISVRTNDADICRGSVIIGANQNTYAFSHINVELRKEIKPKMPLIYYALFLIAVLILVFLIQKMKKPMVDKKEIESVKKEVEKS